MRKAFLKWTAALAIAGMAFAVETQTWEHSRFDEFQDGTRENLSLRSDGVLSLAPASSVVLDASLDALWGAAVDSQGNLYVGGGGPGSTPATLFRIDPAGNSTKLAEFEGLEVQAVAVDSEDRVYAATSPDGKVYRVAADGTSEVYYDPGAKYIWAMAFNSSDELFVGTGDLGEIHRVTAANTGSVFFRTEESHVRSLAFDGDGNLIVGTEPSGLIIRVSPEGQGFVLYQSDKGEITSVAVAGDGTIYAAGVGDKRTPNQAPQPQQQAVATTSVTVTAPMPPGQSAAPQAAQQRPAQAAQAVRRPLITGGSDLYRIGVDGHPETLWTNDDDVIYSIAFDGAGKVLFGTGNDGKIYRLDDNHLYTVLAELPPDQVTALESAPGDKLYALTGNVGQVYAVGPALESEGSYESPALDAGYFATWGRLSYRGSAAQGSVTAETRSGNLDRPQQDWSPWSDVPLSGDARAAAPAARFLQYRLTLHSGGDGSSPEVSQVEVAYLEKNVAPVVEAIETTPPNFEYPRVNIVVPPQRTIVLSQLGSPPTPPTPNTPPAPAQSMQYEKGQQGARWQSHDDNGDDLRFRLEIRGVGENDWKLIEDDLQNQQLSWDTMAYPDGEYQVRVTASDSESNPPALALSGSLESEPFLIDNTPPAVTGMTASRNGNQLAVRWSAADALSTISKAEYSLDGGDWTVVLPTTQLSDALQLDYVLDLDNIGAGEHTITVRVTDHLDNQGLAKSVVE